MSENPMSSTRMTMMFGFAGVVAATSDATKSPRSGMKRFIKEVEVNGELFGSADLSGQRRDGIDDHALRGGTELTDGIAAIDATGLVAALRQYPGRGDV